jgi:hypothetical protein
MGFGGGLFIMAIIMEARTWYTEGLRHSPERRYVLATHEMANIRDRPWVKLFALCVYQPWAIGSLSNVNESVAQQGNFDTGWFCSVLTPHIPTNCMFPTPLARIL